MTLNPPVIITPRLCAGLQIGSAFLSIDYARRQADGRTVYQVYIDLPDGTEYASTELRSGCQGGTLQQGLGGLLTFLSAAVESYQYRQRTGRPGENEDLFPPKIVEWAAGCVDDLDGLRLEIEEAPSPVIVE